MGNSNNIFDYVGPDDVETYHIVTCSKSISMKDSIKKAVKTANEVGTVLLYVTPYSAIFIPPSLSQRDAAVLFRFLKSGLETIRFTKRE